MYLKINHHKVYSHLSNALEKSGVDRTNGININR
jgi:DNA-binding CsgD family transcriptional regulator